AQPLCSLSRRSHLSVLSSTLPRPPTPTLFPYTTLFRSRPDFMARGPRFNLNRPRNAKTCHHAELLEVHCGDVITPAVRHEGDVRLRRQRRALRAGGEKE